MSCVSFSSVSSGVLITAVSGVFTMLAGAILMMNYNNSGWNVFLGGLICLGLATIGQCLNFFFSKRSADNNERSNPSCNLCCV